jgi:hypothetical protein
MADTATAGGSQGTRPEIHFEGRLFPYTIDNIGDLGFIDVRPFCGYNSSSVILAVDATMRAQALSAKAEGHWRTS